MERAKWNDLEISATDIASDYQKEEVIRRVSGKELFCPDPECESPLLKYCRGEKKRAYFAHLHDGNCDYAQFDRQPSILREILSIVVNGTACESVVSDVLSGDILPLIPEHLLEDGTKIEICY